jgi:hypothetical protein
MTTEDWKKERTTQNYCGWCDNSPTGGICTGNCFNDLNNRVKHILYMLKQIPLEIERLKEKEEKYLNELTIKSL